MVPRRFTHSTFPSDVMGWSLKFTHSLTPLTLPTAFDGCSTILSVALLVCFDSTSTFNHPLISTKNFSLTLFSLQHFSLKVSCARSNLQLDPHSINRTLVPLQFAEPNFNFALAKSHSRTIDSWHFLDLHNSNNILRLGGILCLHFSSCISTSYFQGPSIILIWLTPLVNTTFNSTALSTFTSQLISH